MVNAAVKIYKNILKQGGKASIPQVIKKVYDQQELLNKWPDGYKRPPKEDKNANRDDPFRKAVERKINEFGLKKKDK